MPYHQQEHIFTKQLTVTATRRYLLYLPREYDAEQATRWPLILFLHGSGERGENLELVTNQGLPKLIEQGQDFPFIIVSPQCPTHGWWTTEINIAALAALIDEIEQNYAVDHDRIYLTGISMGGYGAWALATAYPDRFAAVVPICGGGNPTTVCALRHIPVWTFHGDQDRAVPIEQTLAMVDALQACGGNVKFTVYPGVGHDSWTRTYDNPELYRWFLEQHRSI